MIKQTNIVIKGIGAVSPAGWSASELVEKTLAEVELPFEELVSKGCDHVCKVRRVPKPPGTLPFARHPRLRRASTISKYVTQAGLQALGELRAESVRAGELNLGIIVVFATGCVTYTRRFYEEVLDDPALASPILFPETVFNAPASHLSAILGSRGISYTLLGDGAEYLSGLQLATEWLSTHQCDGCLVIGGEETDWLISEAVHLFSRSVVLAEGAGALYLERSKSSDQTAICLSQLSKAVLYNNSESRESAAQKVREILEFDKKKESDTLLLDGLQGVTKIDHAESKAWQNWQGQRLSPRQFLGDALGASAAWQCVSAVSLLESKYNNCDTAIVNALGLNQQSRAAVFARSVEQ